MTYRSLRTSGQKHQNRMREHEGICATNEQSCGRHYLCPYLFVRMQTRMRYNPQTRCSAHPCPAARRQALVLTTIPYNRENNGKYSIWVRYLHSMIRQRTGKVLVGFIVAPEAVVEIERLQECRQNDKETSTTCRQSNSD